MIESINDLFDRLDETAEELPGWQEDMMYDAEATNRFVDASVRRHSDKKGMEVKNTAAVSKRRSVRSFSDEPVSFDSFSAVLSCLSAYEKDGKIRFAYPSAGGLYPVDVYVYVKEGRVENVNGGIYLYLPLQNEIMPVSEGKIPEKAHYFGNREIFSSSAFSVYLVYDAERSMPKYNGMGLYYGIVDSGIMLGYLTEACEANGIGSCIIGDMNFASIRDSFGLSENMIYLSCMEAGNFNGRDK